MNSSDADQEAVQTGSTLFALCMGRKLGPQVIKLFSC